MAKIPLLRPRDISLSRDHAGMTTRDRELSKSNTDRWDILLLAHGAPDCLDDIPEFLTHVRGGRPLPEASVQEIVHRYAQVGGGSPLLKHTTRQAQALAKLIGLRVYVGMRNWKPFIADTIRRMADEGTGRVVALCLAPQNSRTSVGLYRKTLLEALEKNAPHLRLEFIESWHDHPLLIEAFREKVEGALDAVEAQAGRPVPVIFTAHSVPTRALADGDPYDRQVRESAALVGRAARLSEWRVAFQSQGMTQEPWLGPTVESQIDSLVEAGHRQVLLAPIGFVSDHMEILYDIDVAFRDYGRRKGVTLVRSDSLNDSATFIRALAAIVTGRMKTKTTAKSQ